MFPQSLNRRAQRLDTKEGRPRWIGPRGIATSVHVWRFRGGAAAHLRKQFALGRAEVSSLHRMRDWQTIGRKLPLLTTVLLSIAVTLISGTAYREMKRT